MTDYGGQCVRHDLVGTISGCFLDFQWHEFLTTGVSVSDEALLVHLIAVVLIFSGMNS